MKYRGTAPFIVLIIILIVSDQSIKAMVEAWLPLHQAIEILPFLAIFHTRNTGIAFSLFAGLDGVWLGLLAVAVVIILGRIAIRTDPRQIVARFGFALIIGGAMGNLIDRFLRGFVVDYIYFHLPTWSFAVFNLADAFITIGAILVVADEFFGLSKRISHINTE